MWDLHRVALGIPRWHYLHYGHHHQCEKMGLMVGEQKCIWKIQHFHSRPSTFHILGSFVSVHCACEFLRKVHTLVRLNF